MYLERKRLENSPTGKYRYHYLVECPGCKQPRWQSDAKSTKQCKPCGGRDSYVPSKVDRKDKRKNGDGYITKQGYHLVFDGEKYVPAHRMTFPNIPDDWVVHHVDGDKLHNLPDNLVPLSKQAHRELHGQLEHLSYSLIQSGLIQFDHKTSTYSLSTPMKEFMGQYSVNSVKLLPGGAEDNTEPSLIKWGRRNDYPAREYSQVAGSAEHPTSIS